DRPPPRKESGEELLSLSSERHRAPESPPAAPDPPPAAPDPPAAAKPEAARASAPRATTAATVPLPPGAADVLAELERNSTAPNVGDLLAALIDNAAAASKLGRFEQVFGVIVGVIRVEVRVTEASGELGMEDAGPAQERCLDHAEERVSKAVGLALAKIGTRGAAEPLRRALRDRSQEVRMQVAVGIGGRKSSALAMPLVVAMEEEKDEAVVRELILALGRIGSPDAVQALIKWAQPTGRFF